MNGRFAVQGTHSPSLTKSAIAVHHLQRSHGHSHLSRSLWLLALLKCLSRAGLCHNSRLGPTLVHHFSFRGLRILDWDLSEDNISVDAALIKLFCTESNDYIEYFVGQLIRCGFIGVSSDSSDDEYEVLSQVLDLLSCNVLSKQESAFRIARQLFALGIFRERGALSFHRYLQCNPVDEARVSSICNLQTEFFRNPLSLQQQSRAAIRQLVGMNDFEGRVQNFPLPPLLLKYLWKADEMLSASEPPEGFKNQPF